MKKVLIKTLNVIVDIVIILILITSVFVLAMSLTSRNSGVPNLFGVAPMTVRSNSMEGTFDTDDLLLCKVVESPLDEEYKVGDIVTFKIDVDGYEAYNTHRIVKVYEEDNEIRYQTQGDNKKTNPTPDEQYQTKTSIIARYDGNKIDHLGGVLAFLQTQLGFFLCVLLPMIIFFLYEAVRVVINILAYNKEKTLQKAQEAFSKADLTEEQKAKAIEEYLAMQQSREQTPRESIGVSQADDKQPEEPTEPEDA
jgi:signal peptidase